MWAPFVIGHLHLSGYMARFVVKIEYQKGNCVGEIGLQGSKYISCSRFHNLEGLYDHLNLHVDLQGWDDKLQDSQLLSKWGKFPMWYSAQNHLWSWKLPTIGPNTLGMWILCDHSFESDTYILSGIWQGFKSRMHTKKTCVTMRLDYLLKNIYNVLVSNVNTIWRAYVITQRAIIES
jgi:hypothetical protein